MRTFPFIRSISIILMPCLLLLCVGCYSYQTQKETKDLRRGEEILVVGTDGLCYRLSYWSIDTKGNLRGTGKVYRSESDATSEENAERFQGTLSAQEIASVQAERMNYPLTIGLAVLISGACLLGLFALAMSGFEK